MVPLVAVLIQALLPVAVNEVKKQIASGDPHIYEDHTDVPTAVAAPIAAKAAVKGLIKSKTSWFGVALLILGFLEQNQQLLATVVPTEYFGVFMSGVGFLTILLRTVTTTSVVEKAQGE